MTYVTHRTALQRLQRDEERPWYDGELQHDGERLRRGEAELHAQGRCDDER